MKYQTCVRMLDVMARRWAQNFEEAGGRHGAHSASNALSLRRSTGADHLANFTFSSQVVALSTLSQSSSRYAYALSSSDA